MRSYIKHADGRMATVTITDDGSVLILVLEGDDYDVITLEAETFVLLRELFDEVDEGEEQ